MILYQLAKQFEQRTQLQAAIRQTTDEPLVSDLLMQMENLQGQIRMHAESLIMGMQTKNDGSNESFSVFG
ncbi:hypothetical protein E0485_21030 [Paenibacillus albiflavus]|uniref:Uncharacterized protein n=1 Tax=Paenibacillus albiflavus TaxID=2545760 RepID=A0A4R4E6D6_9BACL|nr:hypothetical protein [Paenibacillus albiflavus]TCZ73591.1 hypothetical protein E0485_21030 [Paenibacillus albiflavus]